MVIPLLKVYVPRLLIPVEEELAVVAPVKLQVKVASEQLSAILGLLVDTDALHDTADVLAVKLPLHEMVGDTLSVTVTVYEQVEVFPAASATV